MYNIHDKPKLPQLLIFALQQVLAILAATVAVPGIIGHGMSQSAALFGAGIGTLVYQLFTRFKSPVYLGSSFAFLGSMGAAFGGAVAVAAGHTGRSRGAVMAGLVCVVIALVVKCVGVRWIDRLMPAAVIGPTVAIIGLSLSANAIGDLGKGKVLDAAGASLASPYVTLICGLATLFAIIIFSVYGKKMIKLIPFILGILVGYVIATLFTVIGIAADIPALQVIDFSVFKGLDIFAVPDFTFLQLGQGVKDIDMSFIATLAVAYVPVAFVVFAEHIADHKNLSTIIGQDLLQDPGLHRTLLGDGVGSIAGSLFGGCPNTTYGESVGCVAITRNASVITITAAAILCIVISFFGPFVTFLSSIPNCVMGGVCVALYGFIAVSGLKMVQKVDLSQSKNLFVVSVILITGVGGLTVSFGKVQLTSIACALLLGIATNILVSRAE